ncbi:MAG: hypothetical protein HDR82_09665 [Bacteroides sp.]|nr:hypothetical protein [Bacteroides sp.]
MDFYKRWGFVYVSGDRRFGAPEKKRDVSTYIEEEGEHVDARTVDDVFDYSVKFLIEARNKDLVNANSKIRAWNKAVRERLKGGDVKRCKTVTLYDDYKRCRIVGIPEVIAEVDERDYYRRQDGRVMDCVVVTLTIHVSRPSLCDFDTKEVEAVELRLSTDGESLFVNMSEALTRERRVALLRRGRKRNRRGVVSEVKRWHVTDENMMLEVGDDGRLVSVFSQGGVLPFEEIVGWRRNEMKRSGRIVVEATKAPDSNYIIPCVAGKSGRLTYGLAIYEGDRRVSNVAYFQSNVVVLKTAEGLDDDGDERWFTEYLTV